MAKLIAFYSRAAENYFGGTYRFIETGNTARVAHMLAELTGAGLFEIKQSVPYADDYATCIAQAQKDLRAQARPALTSMLPGLSGYEEIYLGYPIYWGTMPMAVYTFLEALDWTGKTIHPFCTHEGSGLATTERDVRQAAQGARVAKGLAIHGSRVEQARQSLMDWCQTC